MASSTCDPQRRPRTLPTALALLAALSAAAAPPPTADGAGGKGAAEEKLVQGMGLLRDRRYAEALERFRQAYALVPSPLIVYDFGLAYLGLGDEPRALESFDTFLREATGAPTEKREKAEGYRDELRGRVAVVELAADVGAGDLTVDGAPLGHLTFPRRLYLRPGSHEVVARADGAEHATTVTCAAGETVSLALQVGRPPPDGARAGAAAAAGGAALSLAPPAAAASPPSVEVLQQRPAARQTRSWALSAAAAGVVSLGVGAAFGLAAMNDSAAVTAESRSHADFVPDIETSGRRDEKLAAVFLSIGAAAVAAGLALYAWARSRPAGAGTPLGGGP